MERKRFSVLFFIKRSKLLKNGEAPVRVRVTYDRLYVELQLKRSVKVPLWSQEKEKSIGKDRNSVELNHYIDALRVKFYQIYQDLELEGKIISARAIVNRYQGKDETFKTLYNVFKEHNNNCRKLYFARYPFVQNEKFFTHLGEDILRWQSKYIFVSKVSSTSMALEVYLAKCTNSFREKYNRDRLCRHHRKTLRQLP